jgi:hemerythrin-like metal-binding protein
MAGAMPDIVPWRAAYSVGIPQIDDQHKGLVRLINNLQHAMMAGTGKSALSSIINDLIRYTEIHFEFEEAMLQQHDYSDLAAHQREHQELTRQVCELRSKLQSGELVITMEVLRFLKNWLTHHILDRDQDYARELNR